VSWQPSTDNVGVTGYQVLRNNTRIATVSTASYRDSSVAPSSSYRYTVVAFDAAGNSSAASAVAQATTPAATGNVIQADASNYLQLLDTLKPGDTLRLAAGNYGVNGDGTDTGDVPGLPIFDLNGTEAQPITLAGPTSGPPAKLLGRSTHNTIRLDNASYVIVRDLEVDGRDLGGDGVSAQGVVHHITLENLYIHGVGADQLTSALSANSAPTWNWTIRHNLIAGAGTGIYLGNSDGRNPSVNNLIEHNVFRDTVGYNMQVKHQLVWSTIPAGMPTSKTATVIRHNVFQKSGNSSGGGMARPNLLVGDQPPSGPGADNGFEIYGNFFYQNPVEVLFQGEGNIAFHDNLLVNPLGTAMSIQVHNGSVRTVRIFNNTVVALDKGISVSGGQAGTTQRVTANAVFAGTPISVSGADATASDNVTSSQSSASTYLNNPTGALGALDLFPKAGQLSGTSLATTGLTGYVDYDRDFNGAGRNWSMRGAYSGQGVNPGWKPVLDFKP
jgi:hypothetical protein